MLWFKIGIVDVASQPTSFGQNFFINFFKFCLKLGLSFNYQANSTLSNGWDSSKNHCFCTPLAQPNLARNFFLRQTFLPKWAQIFLLPKWMQGNRVIRRFIVHRVKESQSHNISIPYMGGGWNFWMPIFNKFPYSLCSQGDDNSNDLWIIMKKEMA